MKEEEGRRIAVVDAFHVAKKSFQELKVKLTKEEGERKNTAATLDSVERQAEGQKVLVCNVEDQLAASNEKILALKE